MKYLLSALLSLLLLPVLVCAQQNHVPNGDFEYYTSCPTNISQLSNCTGWRSWGGTCDYYNSCSFSGSNADVPSNFFGFQYAASSQAYVGAYSNFGSINASKEYLTRPIIPLQPGRAYEVSLSVSLADASSFGTNDVGVYFYDHGPTTVNNNVPAFATPQVDWPNIIVADTQNWTRLTKTFIADSAYDNIAIGGFKNINVDTLRVRPSSSWTAYYYFDSITVKLYIAIELNYSDTLLCAADTIKVPFSIYGTSVYYQNNNVLTLQLSDATGDFSSPKNIGTLQTDTNGVITGVIPKDIANGSNYRLRIVSSSGADTSKDNGLKIKIANIDSTIVSVATNNPICIGNSISFNATTTVSPTTYAWAGPNGFNSTLQNPTISGATTSNSGNYYATLKFYGCEVKDTLSVTVKPLPAKPVANNNSPLCASDSLHLSSTSSTNGVSYSWAGPGGFSSSIQDTSLPNSTVAMSGDYIVTANLNGCNRKDTTTVLVKPLPAAVTLSNNGPLCAGDTLHLSSTASTTGVSYSWTGPGSFTANTQNTSISNAAASATGWYKMLVGLNGCTYTDSTYATIHPIPAVPNISYTNPLCIGEILNLGTATISGASYSWSGPGNFSSYSQSPTRSNMQFGDTGVYQLTTTVNGCTSDTAAATVHINPLPFVVIFSTPADSICQGDRVNFTALPNNHGGSPAYQWYVNGQASGVGTVFSTTALNNQDVVHCDMTENTKCSSPYTDPSNDITMNVLQWMAPTVSISVNPNRPLKENEYATFTATATNAGNNPQYQWKRNGQDIVGATGSVWSANTLNDNDSISVEIISSYKCPQPPDAVSNGIVMKVLTGVTGMNNINRLVLYPNPNNGKFVLKGEAPLRLSPKGREVLNLEIINAMGQVVFKGDIITENGKLYKEIDMQQVPAGLYMLRLAGTINSAIRFSVK